MADIGTSDRQISLPFSFGPDGSVSSTTDLTKQLQDHVFSAVGTQVNERVMNSTYGTDIIPYLFSNIDDLTEQEVTQQISNSLGTNVPEVSLQSVGIVPDPTNGSLGLQVDYTLGSGDQDVSTATVPVALNT